MMMVMIVVQPASISQLQSGWTPLGGFNEVYNTHYLDYTTKVRRTLLFAHTQALQRGTNCRNTSVLNLTACAKTFENC